MSQKVIFQVPCTTMSPTKALVGKLLQLVYPKPLGVTRVVVFQNRRSSHNSLRWFPAAAKHRKLLGRNEPVAFLLINWIYLLIRTYSLYLFLLQWIISKLLILNNCESNSYLRNVTTISEKSIMQRKCHHLTFYLFTLFVSIYEK